MAVLKSKKKPGTPVNTLKDRYRGFVNGLLDIQDIRERLAVDFGAGLTIIRDLLTNEGKKESRPGIPDGLSGFRLRRIQPLKIRLWKSPLTRR